MNRDPIDSGFAMGVSKPENGRLGEDLSVADETKGPPDAILRLHSPPVIISILANTSAFAGHTDRSAMQGSLPAKRGYVSLKW